MEVQEHCHERHKLMRLTGGQREVPDGHIDTHGGHGGGTEITEIQQEGLLATISILQGLRALRVPDFSVCVDSGCVDRTVTQQVYRERVRILITPRAWS